jgi:hypothetical protein
MYTTDYIEKPPREFLGAVGRVQSYLNIAYLLLSFPLGTFYFVFLVAGISTGLSLLVVWVGIPILALVLAASRGLAQGERQMANALLDAGIARPPSTNFSLRHPWRSLKSLAGDGWTWTGLLFLMLKFPLGIFSFVLTISLLAVTVALLLVPIAMRHVPVQVAVWQVRSSDAALLCFAVGLILAIVSIYALNGVAALWRALARALLAAPAQAPSQAAPLKSGPVVIP